MSVEIDEPAGARRPRLLRRVALTVTCLAAAVGGYLVIPDGSETSPARPNGMTVSPTRIVAVTPVTATGEPAPGYTVTPGGDVGDCMPSPMAGGPGIVSCSPNVAGAHVCWVQADRISLLCGQLPWERTLLRHTASAPVESTPASAEPAPWGFELANGLRCRVRIGGMWGVRLDGYVPAYGCYGDGDLLAEGVLGRGDEDLIDKSSPAWRVAVGTYSGQPDEAPPTWVPVVTVYMAGGAG